VLAIITTKRPAIAMAAPQAKFLTPANIVRLHHACLG
jgi:hypothetical protein